MSALSQRHSPILEGVVSAIESATGRTARVQGGRHRLCCPAHDDHNPSLSVWSDDQGNVAVKCFTGCTTDDVCAAIGMQTKDLFVSEPKPLHAVQPVKRQGVTTTNKVEYVYTDADGKPLYRVMRVDSPGAGKKVWQETRMGQGWSKTGPAENSLVPYRLPELLTGVLHDATIYVVEGEKCADALHHLGLIATTNPGGAGKWKERWAPYFNGARVIVLPDNDDAGRAHAETVTAALRPAACSIVTVTLPGLPEKGDVADWLAAGNSRLDLLTIVADATESPSAATPEPGKRVETKTSNWAWPVPDEGMFYGPLGDLTRILAAESEADPAAIYTTMLTGVGAMIGRDTCAWIGNSKHQLQLFSLVIGDTARARKGTSYSDAARALELIDPSFMSKNEVRNLSSGEGLIHRLRDPRADETDAPADKRSLVYLSEFSTALRNANRESNNLSGVIREAWDGGKLETLTRSDPMTATGYHLGLVGHITINELRRELSETAQANGFANRFLFIGARRPHLKPRPRRIEDDVLIAYTHPLRQALSQGRTRRTIEFSEAGWDAWERIYAEIESAQFPTMVTQLVVRGSAYVVRIAGLHALIDGTTHIEPHHLEAAYALWRYSQDTVLHIYGDTVGDKTADTMLRHLRKAGEAGMNGREISKAFSNHLNADQLRASADYLSALGLIEVFEVSGTNGRPSILYRAK